MAAIDFTKAKFLVSAARSGQLPSDLGMEIAFAGRSNAGKSSALNRLTRQQGLARTSKTPGRTQLINLFALDMERRLVDLPGYGYAQVPKAVKERWQQGMLHYFANRRSLCGLVLLMDIRHPFMAADQQWLTLATQYAIPLHILLTKCDKLSRGKAQNTLREAEATLVGQSIPATVQLFSAVTSTGLSELTNRLTNWFA
jgi:GTP-binding protein